MKKNGYSGRAMESNTCELQDNDMLVSVCLKNEKFASTMTRGGRHRLLRKRQKKGLIHTENGGRTVLSWLIHSQVIFSDETIWLENDNTKVKSGLITQDGILCECCRNVLSVSEFKSHTGFALNQPCTNLVVESGKPLMLCQLEAWSKERRAKKPRVSGSQVDDTDQTDDLCNLCGLGGNLVCCSNYPATLHQACLFIKNLQGTSGRTTSRCNLE